MGKNIETTDDIAELVGDVIIITAEHEKTVDHFLNPPSDVNELSRKAHYPRAGL